jgi:ABC-2 type transport system permease protein
VTLEADLVEAQVREQQARVDEARARLALPSIMLSGYIFPIASLPGPLQVLSRVLPATHFIAISRGIIIRGAGFADLWPHVAALLALALLLVAVSTRAFRKTIS